MTRLTGWVKPRAFPTFEDTPPRPELDRVFPELKRARDLITDVFGTDVEFGVVEALNADTAAAYRMPLSESAYVDQKQELMVKELKSASSYTKTSKERIAKIMDIPQRTSDDNRMRFKGRVTLDSISHAENCIFIKGKDQRGVFVQLMTNKHKSVLDYLENGKAGLTYDFEGNIGYDTKKQAYYLWATKANKVGG